MVRWITKFETAENKALVSAARPFQTLSEISRIKSKDLTVGYLGKSVSRIDNFELTKGSILTIKGPSGAGKSTLIATIAGLIPPVSGDISYNEISLTKDGLNPEFLEKVGYVGPEPFICPATVKENLLFANKESHSDSDLWNALALVGLQEDVANFSAKLLEPLNENTQLSTGQKQRLSFARAILRNPELLILDEATANLDQDTERKIIDQISTISRTTIVIAVTHKNSYDAISTSEINLKKVENEQQLN
jgi:ABC-type bacteriocin/lantibiotic exporter with double-glycine peptidase domain